MVLERLAPVRLFDVCLVAVACHAEDLVVVLALATSERRLATLELAAQRAHVRIGALEFGLLKRGAEVRDRVLVLLVVQPDASARAQRLEGARQEEQGRLGVDEGVVVAGELYVCGQKACMMRVTPRRTLTSVVARLESNVARS